MKAPHQVPLDIVKALMTDTELLKQVGIGRIFLKNLNQVLLTHVVPGAVLSSDLTNDMLADTAAGSSLRLKVMKCEHLGLANIKHVFNNILNMLLYLRLNIYSKLPHYTPFVTVNGKKVVEADVEATNGVIVIDHYEC